MFDMEDHSLDGLDVKLLTTASDNSLLGLIESILTDNGILYIERERESGGYMRILGGFSIFGTDIYVNVADYEQAKGLLDAYMGGGEDVASKESVETEE